MTKEEILAMEAGRELDIKVAKEVFNCFLIIEGNNVGCGCPNKPHKDFSKPFYELSLMPYSTDISAAWQVAEKMVSSGYAFCFDWASGKVATVIRCIFEENFSKAESEESEWIDGKTAPEAICKAALLTRLEVGTQ